MAKKYHYLFIFLVIVKALSYWIVSWWQHPNDPLSTIVVYRVGDIQFYPLISALSNFNLGEFSLFEFRGHGLSSFPFATIFIHSLLYRFLGLYGYIAADILIALSYYVILSKILRLAGITPFLARLSSLLVVTGAVGLALSGASKFIFLLLGKGYPLDSLFWGWRIPRPFVSEIFLLGCIYFILKITSLDKSVSGKKYWVILGICLSAVLQGDVHSAICIFMAVFYLLLFLIMGEKRLSMDLVKKPALFLASFVIFSIPFIIQISLGNHDVSRRLGLFPIARSKFYYLNGESIYWVLVMTIALFIVVTILLNRYLPYFSRKGYFKTNAVILLGICWTAYFAQPVSIIALGKGIQINQFGERFVRISLLISSIYALYLFILFCDTVWGAAFLKKILRRGLMIKSIVFSGALVILVIIICQAGELSENKLPMPVIPSSISINDYRDDFVSLVKELDGAKYKNYRVVGTFDPQVYIWWVSFKDGCSYLPDPVTPLPDSVIEERFLTFCKIVGMPRQVFNNFGISFFMQRLCLLKYQASKIYTFKPLSDYEPFEQELIMRNSPMSNSWFRIMPKSERVRLIREYSLQDSFDSSRLDMIIITKELSSVLSGPDLNKFKLSYENHYFKVWIREAALEKRKESNDDIQ